MTMVEKVSEMTFAALVQEAVSRVIDFVFTAQEKKPSQRESDLVKRLQKAHLKMASALEWCSGMPITEEPLQLQRMKIKQDLWECHGVLLNKLRRDKQASSSSKKIKFLSGTNLLSSSGITKYEKSAKEADKLVSYLKADSTLAHYRFYLNPLVTRLLEGRAVWYKMEQGFQGRCLMVHTCPSEEHGMVAMLGFKYKDLRKPMASVYFTVTLRLMESTDIIGITVDCLKSLQSLDTQLTSLADLAVGEVAQISSQVLVSPKPWQYRNGVLAKLSRMCRQDPFCCKADGIYASENTVTPSELTRRFPEPVIMVRFDCPISAPRRNSTRTRARRSTCPTLNLTFSCAPHCSNVFLSERSLQEAEEAIHTEAIEFFVQNPDDEEYKVYWYSGHGSANFIVSKPVAEIKGTNTQRVSKRKRSTGYLQNYLFNPYVVLTTAWGCYGAHGLWVQPSGDGYTCIVQPIWVASH